MPNHILIALLLGLFVLTPDETVRRYGGADRTWILVEMGEKPLGGEITLTFPKRHRLAGEAPCNRFNTTNITPYPWFDAGPITSTRRSCPEMDTERAFFSALETATIAVVEGDTLTFSSEEETLLVFKAAE